MNSCIYEVILPVAEKDLITALKNIQYIKDNLNPAKIIIIASKKCKSRIEACKYAIFKEEDSVLPELKLSSVRSMIEDRIGSTRSSGWYFQQFIKMGYSAVSENPYYVVWDADTIPLNGIDFISDNNRYLLTMKSEYHPLYFKTIQRLLGVEYSKSVNDSFISENMIIDTQVMKQLISAINKSPVAGQVFWEKILHAIDDEEIEKNGFSEYETYGTFFVHHYPEKVAFRKLRTLREGAKFLGKHPSRIVLSWASKSYDTISIENRELILLVAPIWLFFPICTKVSLENIVKTFDSFNIAQDICIAKLRIIVRYMKIFFYRAFKKCK